VTTLSDSPHCIDARWMKGWAIRGTRATSMKAWPSRNTRGSSQ
jgi:hypothetical protein